MVDTENSSSSLGDDRGTGNTSVEFEEQSDEHHLVTNQRKSAPARTPRTSTKWPNDKIAVTEIDMSGMPTKIKEQNRLRRLAGLIARQRISLVMPGFNSLNSEQKWKLFDLWVTPHLEFPPEMKELGFSQVMKHVAKSWRTHKSDLVRNYVSKGLEPFRKHPYIVPEDWDEFVQLKSTKESKEESSKYKGLRKRSSHEHSLGSAGYDRKLSQWEKEDLEMSAQGIPNPWDQYPEGRPRNWLRARSRIEMSGGSARIVWNRSATEKMSEKMKEMHEQAQASSVTWVRENDLLSACLGPEQPGRVRGFSSYMGWKHGWPECSNLYRKRRNNEVDVDAITARVTQEVTAKVTKEVTHNVTKEVSALLASMGVLQLPTVLTQPPSPAHRKRPSSCASASDVGGHINDQHMADGEQPRKEDDAARHNGTTGHNGTEVPDPIAGLIEPTPCAFQINLGGYLIEVARGRVFPSQTVLHTVQVPKDHVVVQLEFVHSNFADHVLPVPHNDDEITTLGQALLQRIQWKKAHVVVKPTPLDGSSGPQKNSGAGSNSSPKVGSAPNTSSNPDGASCGAKSGANASQGAASANDALGAAPKKAPKKAKTAPAPHSLENQAYTKGSKRVSAASEAKEDARNPSTKSNPNFKYGQPMLTRDELDSAGRGCIALHAYYMKSCVNDKKASIVVQFKRKHFLRGSDTEYFFVGFNDLYDLFTLEALDMSLLRCFTLFMISEAKEKALPVGFLDCQMMSITTLESDRSGVVAYVRKSLATFAKKDYIMFAHNTIGHWILVVLIPKWNKAMYLDSERSKARDHRVLKGVLDEAYDTWTVNRGRPATGKLAHATKFPCHQQPPGNLCGFYTAHHMMVTMGLTNLEEAEEFEVLTSPINNGVLFDIREKLASFTVSKIINNKGEFHCNRPGAA